MGRPREKGKGGKAGEKGERAGAGKTIRTRSGFVINATVEGFARKCCAAKICNLTGKGCNQHVEDCFLSDREISETLLSITMFPLRRRYLRNRRDSPHRFFFHYSVISTVGSIFPAESDLPTLRLMRYSCSSSREIFLICMSLKGLSQSPYFP